MDIDILEQGVQYVRKAPLMVVEEVELNAEKAVTKCVKRSEMKTEHDKVDKSFRDVEASLNSIPSWLESLEQQLAVPDKNTQGLSGRCDENAQGFSSVQTLLGGDEKGTEEATTRGRVVCDGDRAAAAGDGNSLCSVCEDIVHRDGH